MKRNHFLRDQSVKVRERTGLYGRTLFLAYWSQAQKKWIYEPLTLPRLTKRNQADWAYLRNEAQRIAVEKTKQQADAPGEMLLPSQKEKFDFVKFFREEGQRRGQPAWKQAADLFEKFAPQGVSLRRMTSKTIENFREFLLKQEGAQNTKRLRFVIFRMAIMALQKQKKLPADLLLGIDHIEAEETVPVWLEAEELSDLVANIDRCSNRQVALAFLFSCHTGLRRSDIYSLCWGEIQKNIHGFYISKKQKKTKGPVIVPLDDTAQEILNEQRESLGNMEPLPTALVFALPPVSNLQRTIHVWAALAGVKQFTFHAARHSFVSIADESIGNPVLISRMAGHRNISMTLRYRHSRDAEAFAAIRKTPQQKINGGQK